MKEIKEKIKKIEKKKIIVAAIFLLIITIILYGGSIIYNKFFYKRSYTEIENIMLDAAKNHMNKNKEKLPTNINETLTLSVNDLVRLEEMKDISEYTKDETIKCDGKVLITNINQTYRYTPFLDCGEQYKTKKFIDYIKETNPIIENGNGLYNINEQLVFRGDNVNNYIEFGDELYRIVKFTNDETVIIYSEETQSLAWDNRYNIDKKVPIGINDYSVSRIKEYLNSVYDEKTKKNTENKTNINNEKLIIAYPLEIGKRNDNDTDKTGTLEKSAIIENQFIGLLPLYDYLNASLDKNCTKTTSASCMNYNYLSNYEYKWWTMTATSNNTYDVYYIDKYVMQKKASNNAKIRHVFHLAKDALYVSGNGTKNNPYIVK